MINWGYKSANFFNGFNIPSQEKEERSILNKDLKWIQKRCYDLHRNNSQAKAISRIMSEYVGATGYKLNVPNDQELQRITEDWMQNCTVRGDDFLTFRKNRITEIVEGGGVLTLFTQDPDRKPYEIGLKLDLVEAGRVCTPPEFNGVTPKTGKKVFNGIAYNSFGKEIGFYYKDGENYKYVEKYNELGMLKAYFERSPEAERPNVAQSLPLISCIVEGLEYRDQIIKNMVTYSTNASALGVFFETPDPSAVMQGFGLKDDDGNLDTESLAGKTQIAGDVHPQLMGMAPVGTKVNLITPEGSANFEPVLKIVNRDNASGVGIPEEILANATDGKNFAVSKFVSQGFIKKIQNWARSLNRFDSLIVKSAWEEMIMRGMYPAIGQIEWGGSADFDEVDASKSADASQKRVSGLSSTYSKETARRGGDFEDNVNTTVKEMQIIKENAEKAGFTFGEYMAFIKGDNIGVSVSTSTDPLNENSETSSNAEVFNVIDFKERLDAYGVGVRAGAYTPQTDDEEFFRKMQGLPSMSANVLKTWDDVGGVKQPITLQTQDKFDVDEDGNPSNSEDSQDDEVEDNV